jgi:hypothetical protein
MSQEFENDTLDGWGELGATYRGSVQNAPFEDVDLKTVRSRSRAFARTIHFRNAREIAAGALLVVLGFGQLTHAATWAGALAGATMSLGALFVTAFIVLRARNLKEPGPAAPTNDVLAYEHEQLERQARLLERVWLWYLAPLLPSVLLIYGDVIWRTGKFGKIGLLFVGTMAFFALIGWINMRSARALRRRMTLFPRPSGE